MIDYYRYFYNNLYRKTNGYIPFWPLKTEVGLGDLCIIRAGRMIKIGNIFDEYFGVYEDIHIDQEWQPVWHSWNTEAGARYAIKSPGVDFALDTIVLPVEKKGMLLQFDYPGAYYFRVPEVQERCIKNFGMFKFKLLQLLASEKFNFKDIFVITSVAKAPSFFLMVAAEKQASALITVPDTTTLPHSVDNLAVINTDNQWMLDSMNGITATHLAAEGGSMFFKAQKLEVSPPGRQMVERYIHENLPVSMQEYSANILDFAAAEILPSVDIFPAKVHELFHFREMNLNDVMSFLGN